VQPRDADVVTLLAGAFGALTLLLVLVGLVAAPVAIATAVPFAIAAGLLWYHASGRFTARVREQVEREERERRQRRQRGPGEQRQRRRRATAGAGGTGRRDAAGQRGDERGGARSARGARNAGRGDVDDGPDRREALRVLGLEPGASQQEIKRAYRRRVKESHPDRGGDERTFQRVTAAYERLQE
jgi:hypothetical protein